MRRIRKLTDGEKDFKNVVDFVVQNFVPEHDMGVLSASNLNLEKGMKWVLFNIREAVFVVEDDGKLIGTIGLNKTSPWYSDAEYLTDGWFYVLPEYRKKRCSWNFNRSCERLCKRKKPAFNCRRFQ